MGNMLDIPTPGPARKILTGIGIVLVLACVVYLFLPAFEFIGERNDQDTLRTSGAEAPAEILSVEQTRQRINNDWVYNVALKVSPQGKKPYQAHTSQTFTTLHVPNLHKGGKVMVRFDRQDPQKLVIVSTGN
jgi:hypothetical protein